MTARPLFVVCEDGTEYVDRFQRLLGTRFRFVRAGSFGEASAALARGAVGLLLDLDFRRALAADLVDESGHADVTRTGSEHRRVSATQGVLILRALRRQGVKLPALLFADFDDADQTTYLETELAPLRVVRSSVGLHDIGSALDQMAAATKP
jgi:hypothetical protein